MKNDELLHKWVNGTITETELEAFQQRPEYASLVELFRRTDSLHVPAPNSEAMLQQVLTAKKARRIPMRTWIGVGIAASILLIAGVFFWNRSVPVELFTDQGERIEHQLPDGSKVLLAVASALNYQDARSIHLEGEAFFTVVKGDRFEVRTPGGKVQVLGTEFNVRARNGQLEVVCNSGKVAVYNVRDEWEGTLGPRDALRIEPDRSVMTWKTTPWQANLTRFRDVPLREVLDELERQFEVVIQAPDIDQEQRVSCNFPNDKLELALQATLPAFGLNYEIQNNKQVRVYEE